MTLDHKTSLKSLGYICSNRQKCIAWVKITFFMPKIIRTLSKDHVPWRYFLNFLPQIRAVRYDDIYRMDEIKSLSFHIMFYRLFRGVAKYIVYGNPFSSFEWLRSLCARCKHGPVLRFICRVCAHVQRCSEQASRYNIQLSDRTGRLWWVTEQNKDGAKFGCNVLKGSSTCLSFFSVLCLSYNLKWQTVCRIYLFFSAALFTVLTARC